MSDPSFWENGDHAKEISQKATEAKAAYDTYTRLFARAESIKELLDMAIEENDQDMEGELEEEINELKDILHQPQKKRYASALPRQKEKYELSGERLSRISINHRQISHEPYTLHF